MSKPMFFCCYLDNETMLNHLSDEQAGRLWKMLFEYANNGNKLATDDGIVDMAFDVMSRQIERDFNKYSEKCAKNRQNRAAANNNGRQRSSTVVNNGDQEKEKKKKKKKNKNEEKEYNLEFEKVWKEYPRKVGKSAALKAYISARRSGIEHQTILNGVRAYRAYIGTNKTEQQYVKHGSTWFTQQGWTDDYILNAKVCERDSELDEIF